jgi:hypothetical protein
MAKGVKVKMWREGRNVLIRSDALHITTYGKSTQDAIENFKEALLLTLDAAAKENAGRRRALPFVFDLGMPGNGSYGRAASAGKAPATC